MTDRTCALSQLELVVQRHPHELARPGDSVGKRRALRQEESDRARQRASGAMRIRGVDALALPARHIVFFDERVCESIAFFVAALDQHRATMLAHEMEGCGYGVLFARQAVQLR